MPIQTDPNDPEFRKALQELGAPDWYPQDAPIHNLNGVSGSNAGGSRYAKFTCPECGWERHFIDGEMKVINKGDPWALHKGSTHPEILQITSFEVSSPDEVPEEFEGFLKGLE
jgi:hypothetical protein